MTANPNPNLNRDGEAFKQYIRDIPDFPQPGILYRDITPLLKNPAAYRAVIDSLATRYRDTGVEAIVAVESRGFMFGAPLAYTLGLPFITARKAGKLPYRSISASYALEYGEATLEMHTDALAAGQRVLVVDDLLATGGTVLATIDLIEQLGATVVGAAFVIELTALHGRDRLTKYQPYALIQY